MAAPIYWIDAGVLIMAKNRHYGFDLVPKFWTFMHKELASGRIRMPKLAFEEVTDGNDQLVKWCKERRGIGYCCVRPDRNVQERYSKIAGHVCEKYTPHQAAEFLKGADGWLIAHALETEGFVVTEENTQHNKSKIKIPTVAKFFHAPWKNTFDMCKELGARF
jgi:Domain of unknown function (DUF4411)